MFVLIVRKDFAPESGPSAPVPTTKQSILVAALALAVGLEAAAAQDADLDDGGNLDLPEISVTANLVETPLSQVGSAVTVITGEELREQQIKFVSEALRQVPGLAVSRTGPLGQLTQVRIRGSEGNQTKVFIDGIPVNDPAAGSEFDFAHLLADDIERIEVLRGPQSALYGSDAVGGVINVVTRRGEGRTRAAARVEGGSFGTLNGNASVSGGTDRYNFIASASGFQTEGISVASTRLGNKEKDGYGNGTVFAKAGYNLTDTFDLSAVVRYTTSRSDLDAETFYPQYGHTGPVDALQDVKGEQFFTRAQARLLLLDGHWEQIAGFAYTDQDRTYRDLDPRMVTSTYDGERARFDYQSTFFFDTPQFLDASHAATFAVEHDEDKAISKNVWSSFEKSIGTTGFVGQYQVSLFEDLSLTGSIRRDDNELFKDSTTYRATAAYFLKESGTKLRGSYGTGVKNPTLFELYGYTNNYRGNPNLKPERGEGWDIGIDQQIFGGGILDITYFSQRITDLITGAGQTSINLPGSSKIDGVELGLSVSPITNLTLRASYTYMNGEDADGRTLVRRPKNLASIDVSYILLDDRAQLNLSVDYVSKQKDWVYSADYNERYIVDLNAYTLVNLAASYQINDGLQLYGRLENILDEKYYEVWGYGTLGFGGYAGVRLTF
ncbi:TonB-dependent receptor plug domain-containing protein [Rhodoligotrophos defluvii]|uniref:TonB-dependent receptor plug domain-containing protein n=1 Tax=Rhodoligotrophos defluvii TaxID=2561934 RepID=UPI0010C9444E|nr:TonB-dependent receptor [Rhodoligotrophos defluvii]